MTVAEAKKELSRPLVFGDAEQIKARDILRKFDDCEEAMRACKEDHTSMMLLRKEEVSYEVRDCFCSSHFDAEIVDAVLRKWGVISDLDCGA